MKIKVHSDNRVCTIPGHDYTWTWDWDDWGPGQHSTEHGFYMPGDMRDTKTKRSQWWPHGPTHHIMLMLRRVLK